MQGVGWGGSCRGGWVGYSCRGIYIQHFMSEVGCGGVGHVEVGWGRVGHAGGGVCHAGVVWVMQKYDKGWGGSCRGGVGWVMQGCGGVGHVGVGGWVIHVEEFTFNFL